MTTWISPGDWTAISTGHSWVLADTSSDAGLVRDLWSSASEDPAAEAVLGRLLADGLSNLKGFAIAAVQANQVRVIVRYPATVTFETGGSSERIAAVEGMTWADVTRDLPECLTMSANAVEVAGFDLPLPHGAGIASSIRVDFAESSEVLGLQPTPPLEQPSPSSETPASPRHLEPDAESVQSEVEEEIPAEAPAANPYLDLLTSSTADRDALVARLNVAEEELADADAEAQPVIERLANGATADWRDLEDQTGGAASPAEEPSIEDPRPDHGALIDGVPGMASGFAEPTPGTAPAMSETRDHVEKTTTRAHLQQLLGAAGIVGPSVLAVRCANGHRTNPMLPTCRTCDGSIPEQTPQEIPRPVLGYIRMPNGDTITVDKEIVLGRAPQSTPGVDQHLVTVNTTSEISRMHAQIAIDGWNVVIRDLNTTNGTFLTAPGQSTVKLRGGEDYLVEPGSEIDLADALTLRFEVRA